MKGFGVILMLVGVGLAFWGISFDISVASDAPVSSIVSLPDRITNMSLVSQREVILAAASAIFAGGCAFAAAGHVLERVLEALAKASPTAD